MGAPSLPHTPGGLSSPSAMGLTTPIAAAPLAVAQSVIASTGSRTPKALGWGMSKAVMSSPAKSSRAAKSVCPPAGSKGRSTGSIP